MLTRDIKLGVIADRGLDGINQHTVRHWIPGLGVVRCLYFPDLFECGV